MIAARLGGLACLLLAGVLAFCAGVAKAEERIHDYQVEIHVMPDGRLQVTEDILLTSEGLQIVHGIERDLPLLVDPERSLRARSALKILDVQRDGHAEHYVMYRHGQGALIRIGQEDVWLSPGEYRYTIRYEMDRVVEHAVDHDRLRWNVNGTYGRFPIDALSARVVLPGGATPEAVDVFTGGLGATHRDASVDVAGDVVFFSATRPYEVGENMTIDLRLPKGFIAAPDAAQRRAWWFRDHGSVVYGIAVVLLCGILALWLWLKHGRGSSTPGVVVPRWDPPDGLSPAQVNYLVTRNFEDGNYWRALSASILALAVKGRVVLEAWVDGTLAVRKVAGRHKDRLTRGQAAILASLPDDGRAFPFTRDNRLAVDELGHAFRMGVVSEAESGQRLFRSPRSICLRFGVFAAVLWLIYDLTCTAESWQVEDGMPLPIHAFMPFIVWSFFALAVWQARSMRFLSGTARLRALGKVLLWSVLSIAIGVAALAALWLHAPSQGDSMLVAIGLLLIMSLLWMSSGQFSDKGRALMDHIQGLRLYLSVTGRNRHSASDAPLMSPSHYETLLPYAVALGVEQAWATRFEQALAAARGDGLEAWHYHPAWYAAVGAGETSVKAMQSFIGGMTASIMDSSSSGQSVTGSASGGGHGGGGVGGW